MGTLQRETGRSAYQRIQDLQARGRPLQYEGWLDDESLNAAFQSCDFTVYPSIMEGFGLPIWESILHGKPCICASFGAVAETAQGGGCLTTDTRDVVALAGAIADLLNDAGKRAELTQSALNRQPNRWSNYADHLTSWLKTLSPNLSSG